MDKNVSVINEILVEIFNDILVIEQESMQTTKYNDISISEIHTIDAIGINELKNMTEVASKLKITMGTLTTAVNNLVKKGYVQRKAMEKDRRVVLVELTETGKIIYKLHKRFHDMMVKRTINGLTKEEEQILIRSLEKLNNFFKETYEISE